MTGIGIRLLLCAGWLGGLVFLTADMAFSGDWGSGASYLPERVQNVVASVPVWRLYLGSALVPLGVGLELLGMLGLWLCCRRVAPFTAAVMLAALYAFEMLGLSTHGKFGPVGFALRYCGSDGDAVRHLLRLNELLTLAAGVCLVVGLGLWMLLTLAGKSGVPRWTVIFSPLITLGLSYALVRVPEPLGFPLIVGWTSLCFTAFFVVVAATYASQDRANEWNEST